MALVVGTNSWITVAEADTILEDHMGASNWFVLPAEGSPGSTSRTSVLVTAYNEIMSSSTVSVEASSTDDLVKQAQAEMALFVIEFYEEIKSRRADISSGLSEFQYSQRKEVFNSRDGGGNPGLPSNVIGLLSEYVQSNITVDMQV